MKKEEGGPRKGREGALRSRAEGEQRRVGGREEDGPGGGQEGRRGQEQWGLELGRVGLGKAPLLGRALGWQARPWQAKMEGCPAAS